MKRFLFSLPVCLSSVTSLGILLLALSMVSFAQNNLPLHINSAPDTPTNLYAAELVRLRLLRFNQSLYDGSHCQSTLECD
jgi:hypothetical protein